MVPASDVDCRDDLSDALTDSLRFAYPDCRGPYAEQLASSLQRAFEQDRPDLAEEIGASLVVVGQAVGGPEPTQVLGRLVGVVQGHFEGHGSSKRLSALLQGLCSGYLGALQDRIELLGEGVIEYTPPLQAAVPAMLAVGPSARTTRLLQAVFAQAGVGVGISDVTGRILVVNTAFAAMFGYDDVEEFVATFKITNLTHPDDPPGVWDLYAKLMRGEVDRLRIEKPHLHRDGHTVWNSINVSLIRGSDGVPAYTLALFEDVTERHQLQERMRREALHDPLTGLANRAQFFDRLTEAFEDSHSRVGICYVDLDGFKAVNDTLGHDFGDKLLVKVADRFRSCLRQPTQLAARVGGDEFIIFVPQPTGTDEVTQLADAILCSLTTPIDIDGHPLTVSASVGVMEEQVANTSALDLVKGAEAALVWAKEAGRNRWAVYDPERENTRYCLSIAMRAALDRGEFFLVYQPIVRLTDNRIIGAEALLRWAHPTLGTLPPDRFIDIAEDNGLIVPLTAYVIEQACRQARGWCCDGTERQPFVSVNVSASNVRDPGFLPLVKSVLADTDLPSHALQLEFTEKTNLSTPETSVIRLQELAALGVGMAIDDFGTGFSSLAYLRTLPVAVVKLDGLFIKNLGGNLHDRLADEQITRAIIDLAHTLGLTVIAEQVETAGQAARLRVLGCDAAQGWHFAKPLSGDRICAALSCEARPH
jgi:diguanylate cyclase (GGDEF)-like protein/PAS domain S-box-containing protein